jgi:hypothetical protein
MQLPPRAHFTLLHTVIIQPLITQRKQLLRRDAWPPLS